MHPTVRYLVACEDVLTEAENARRVTLVGLISAIRSLEQPAYPLLCREISVYIQATECRGVGNGRVEIRHADTDQVAFRTRTRAIPFSMDPLEVGGVVFRMRNVLFRDPGLYWIEFWYNEQVIAQQPLLLR